MLDGDYGRIVQVIEYMFLPLVLIVFVLLGVWVLGSCCYDDVRMKLSNE